jgi:uroporphyrinogen-III synthase
MVGTLSHIHLLNTRPEGQNHALTQAIKAQGGSVIECPMLDIKALPFEYNNAHKHTIFISPNAVKYFFKVQRMKQHQFYVYAIGDQTAYELKKFGITALTPDIPDSEHLLAKAELQHIHGDSVIIIKGLGGRNLLQDKLTLRGAHMTTLEVYQRLPPKISMEQFKQLWINSQINTVLWTSQQAMEQMLNLLDAEGFSWLAQQKILVISHRLADIAKMRGIHNIVISAYDKLLQTMQG